MKQLIPLHSTSLPSENRDYRRRVEIWYPFCMPEKFPGRPRGLTRNREEQVAASKRILATLEPDIAARERPGLLTQLARFLARIIEEYEKSLAEKRLSRLKASDLLAATRELEQFVHAEPGSVPSTSYVRFETKLRRLEAQGGESVTPVPRKPRAEMIRETIANPFKDTRFKEEYARLFADTSVQRPKLYAMLRESFSELVGGRGIDAARLSNWLHSCYADVHGPGSRHTTGLDDIIISLLMECGHSISEATTIVANRKAADKERRRENAQNAYADNRRRRERNRS